MSSFNTFSESQVKIWPFWI